MKKTIFLFDVDGVLINPRGYKEALRATVEHFAARMGLEAMAPSDEDIAIFEACGITSEWDSGPMCVAALLLAASENLPVSNVTAFEELLSEIQKHRPSITRPDYALPVRAFQ